MTQITAAFDAHSAEAMPPYRDVDVLVAGGGMGGVAAAIVAAQQGAKTLLIERHGRLGGMGVNALVAPLMGWTGDHPSVNRMLDRLPGVFDQWRCSFQFDAETADIALADMVLESGAEILLHAWLFDVIMEGKKVCGARMLTKQGVLAVSAKVVIDATGDGDVAFKAGAPFEQGREGDHLLQPMSIMFKIGGFDRDKGFVCGSEEAAHKCMLAEGSWHDIVQAGIRQGELPSEIGVIRIYASRRPNEQVINATQVNYVDGTRAEDLTRAELEGRRQARTVLTFLQKHAPGYEKAYISHMPAVIGVRETRRFLGLEYLTKQDVLDGRKRDDAIARGVSFPIDIHNPAGAGQAAGASAERARPYDIPYGCLVPRETDGILLCGRCISGSHEAHASYRVQKICMATGAAAGAAAALAVQSGRQPRAVDVSILQKTIGI